MAIATILSRATVGIHAPLVEVETHLSNGLPKFSLVGLPETCVKESKERVRSAILNSGFEFPRRRITINLAPADLPKEGGRFDLPIALSILKASGQIRASLESVEFAGELSLTGKLLHITSVLPMAIQTKSANHKLLLPMVNAEQAALISDLSVFGFANLQDVVAFLNGELYADPLPKTSFKPSVLRSDDLAEVVGQHQAKRALTIAAAGGHHLLMSGPPGTGKTMLASRLNTILPELREQEHLEIMAIHSLVNAKIDPFMSRPFRQPHHTASGISLVGGGKHPRPGEISLAHHGVLFLDELTEFKRHVLEVLREPIESGEIHIARAAGHVSFPARFQLIAAMNPCPCGYYGDLQTPCNCTMEQLARYQHKLSGPFLDRIDLHIRVMRLTNKELFESNVPSVSSADLKLASENARALQLERQGKLNAQLTPKDLTLFCHLTAELNHWLGDAIEKLNLSPRAYHRILKVARTIADLSLQERLTKESLLEALHYRHQVARPVH